MKALVFAAAVAVLVALSAGKGSHQAIAGIVATWVVDDQGMDCLAPGAGSSHTTIAAALAVADPGHTIFVCDGTYDADGLQMVTADVMLLGPGFTPADDGVATIVRAATPGSSVMLYVRGDGDRVSGFEFDASPVGAIGTGDAINSRANSVTISDNTFHDAPGSAMYVDGMSGPGNIITIQTNEFTDNQEAFLCFCDNSYIDSNTLQSPSGEGAQVTGTENIFSSNTLNGVRMTSIGDDSTVEYNTFDATGQPMPFPLVTISGNGSSVVGNDFSNGGGLAVRVFDGPQTGPTSTEIILNTFDSMTKGIQVSDNSPGDAFPVTAQIGTEKALANIFINSGGALNPSGHLPPDDAYLLELDGIPTPINAEFNNWGLCTLAEIEAEVNHQPEEPALGLVDYDPFIDPGGCPTPTPVPTATPTPATTPEPTSTATTTPTPTATPTATPVATPTATPAAKYTQGDNDCDEDIDAVDGLADLRNAAGLSPLSQHEPCPDVGSKFASVWGDMDCDEDVDPVDALGILRDVASLSSLPQNEPCPDIGEGVGGSLAGGVLATFNVAGETFRVWVTNDDTIQQLLDLKAGKSKASIPNGALRAGPGRAGHNLPYTWHLDPEDIEMAELTIELCDGVPSYVEEHRDEFIKTVGRFCPWSAALTDLEDHR